MRFFVRCFFRANVVVCFVVHLCVCVYLFSCVVFWQQNASNRAEVLLFSRKYNIIQSYLNGRVNPFGANESESDLCVRTQDTNTHCKCKSVGLVYQWNFMLKWCALSLSYPLAVFSKIEWINDDENDDDAADFDDGIVTLTVWWLDSVAASQK